MKEHTIYIEENNVECILRVGTSKQENDYLVRNSQPDDLWFHLENISGPHFVLSTGGVSVPKRYLNNIAGLFKDYKRGLGNRYTIIYTEICNIKLTKELGTVIPSKTRRIKV